MNSQRYGTAHQRERARWAPLVAAGQVDCWRCGEQIPPDAPWDLGHDDLDSTIHRGPEHQRCNRAVKGRAPNAPPSMNYTPRGRTHAKRVCVVCAVDYTPSWSGQRTCGRACGAELQRRNRPVVERKPYVPKPRRRPQVCAVQFGTCERCDVMFTAKTKAKRFCSDRCMRGRLEVQPVVLATHCAHGHEFTPENTRWRTNHRGRYRQCRQCRQCRNIQRRAEKKRVTTPGVPLARTA